MVINYERADVEEHKDITKNSQSCFVCHYRPFFYINRNLSFQVYPLRTSLRLRLFLFCWHSCYNEQNCGHTDVFKNVNRPVTRYKDAGVDIKAGQQLVEKIKKSVALTHRPEVLSSLGGFGALCRLPHDLHHPLLVSATDGVGTKLRLAIEWNQHQTIGVDLVAMCVNDVLVQGAAPLFFLDYLATSQLDVEQAATVIESIADGCQQAGCALVGGETAEMPSLYQPGDYDLAGFCVGVVEHESLVDGHRLRDGDVLIGLRSSGPHANGYSLIRLLLEKQQAPVERYFNGLDLRSALMTLTRIYVQNVLTLLSQYPVHGMCHITGGGLTENLPRILPAGLSAIIDKKAGCGLIFFNGYKKKVAKMIWICLTRLIVALVML